MAQSRAIKYDHINRSHSLAKKSPVNRCNFIPDPYRARSLKNHTGSVIGLVIKLVLNFKINLSPFNVCFRGYTPYPVFCT